MADAGRAPARSMRRSTWGAVVATGLLAVVLPVGVGFAAQRLDPAQWKWDDWAAVVTSLLLGTLFFVLALIVGREGARRGSAVSDAVLLTTIGVLQMSSGRSFAGFDQQALRIAADARAALKHYVSADREQQVSLIDTIETSYSDLAFGTFSRADGLPRSVWEQLRDGANAVASDARKVAAGLGRRSSVQGDELRRLAEHVTFALSIGSQIRAQHQPLLGKTPVTLDCSWGTVQPEGDAKNTGSETDQVRKNRLKCLYRRELTIKRDWNLLIEASPVVSCVVQLQGLTGTDDWYAPWYVTDHPPPLRPVNVLFDDLGEAAAHDKIADTPGLNRYPEPTRHVSLPSGMRTQAIANLLSLLERNVIATVCVLVYDVVLADGTTKRLVLDGNHRLAAARALARQRERKWPWRRRAASMSDVRVLAFVISEREPVDDMVQDTDPSVGGSMFPDWRGFSPDVGLVRGSWLPPRYQNVLASGPLGQARDA